MFQVRFHGRGGQGVVTAAELLSYAAFLEGQHAQAFPSFGSERTGSPVVSFCRIDDKEIRLREPILEPDGLIVQDPTLFKGTDVFQGLKADGYLLVNTGKSFDELHVASEAARLPIGHACVESRAGIEPARAPGCNRRPFRLGDLDKESGRSVRRWEVSFSAITQRERSALRSSRARRKRGESNSRGRGPAG